MEISPISDSSTDPFQDIRDAWELHMSRNNSDAIKKIDLLEDGDERLLTSYIRFLLLELLHDIEAPQKPWTNQQVEKFTMIVCGPWLGDLLPDIISAVKKQQWFEACQLLREPPRRPTIDEEKYTNSLVRDWEAAYQGKTCKAFMDEIQVVMSNKTARTHAYSQSINIIQSSGMGKSRLVKELGQHVFSWTFTLRRTGEDGFPKGDDDVYAFLTKDSVSDKHTHPRAIALLAGTFSLSKSRTLGITVPRY